MENQTPTPKVYLTISNPEQYVSKSVDENGKRKQRVAYNVTGSKAAIDMYNADMVARTGAVSTDDTTGNPLFTISLAKFAKSGSSSSLVRASKPNADGTYSWFVDDQEQKDLEEIISGADEITKQEHAKEKLAELKANLKAMHANKRAQASVPTAKADLSK